MIYRFDFNPMAKSKRGKSAAVLRAMRQKYGLGEFSAAALRRRGSRRVSTPRSSKKNAKKVPLRAKSRRRTAKKTGFLQNSMNWSL